MEFEDAQLLLQVVAQNEYQLLVLDFWMRLRGVQMLALPRRRKWLAGKLQQQQCHYFGRPLGAGPSPQNMHAVSQSAAVN